jgi:hypothetical protein
MAKDGVSPRIFFVLVLVIVGAAAYLYYLFQLPKQNDAIERMRQAATVRTSVIGINDLKSGNMLEKLELRGDGTYRLTRLASPRAIEHTGVWSIEIVSPNRANVTLNGSDQKTRLQLHDVNGHLALGVDEKAEWYYKRIH